ncbi:uncharacterized protein BCR38DRAFT_339678, partial [Pseudomassariella vexata]
MASSIGARESQAEFYKENEPLVGTALGVVINLLALATVTACFTQRYLAVRRWRRLAFIPWLVFTIYADSWTFIFTTAVLQHGLGVASTYETCSAATFLCLLFYVTTKFIYLFLVERAFVIRNGYKSRLKSKLYLVNSFGMITIYITVGILDIVFRITEWEKGSCRIGMRKVSMIPMISFDFFVNMYLTTLFLIPLRRLYARKHLPQNPASVRLRAAALRAFIGGCCTTASSIVNLTILMIMEGQPAWICLMCCNADILFSAVVIQWVTSKD